jgi:hypothetical protein
MKQVVNASWLRSVIQHIQEKCELSSNKGNPTILYEDNAACITQFRAGYIKGGRTKHISPKFFYTHELQKSGNIDVKQICSSDNLATYSLSHYRLQHSKRSCTTLACVNLKIYILMSGSKSSEYYWLILLFFLRYGFFPQYFPLQGFSEGILRHS